MSRYYRCDDCWQHHDRLSDEERCTNMMPMYECQRCGRYCQDIAGHECEAKR